MVLLLLLLAAGGFANAAAAACSPVVTAAVLELADTSVLPGLLDAHTAFVTLASFNLPEQLALAPALKLRAWLLLAWLLPSACRLPQLPNGRPKQPPLAA